MLLVRAGASGERELTSLVRIVVGVKVGAFAVHLSIQPLTCVPVRLDNMRFFCGCVQNGQWQSMIKSAMQMNLRAHPTCLHQRKSGCLRR